MFLSTCNRSNGDIKRAEPGKGILFRLCDSIRADTALAGTETHLSSMIGAPREYLRVPVVANGELLLLVTDSLKKFAPVKRLL